MSAYLKLTRKELATLCRERCLPYQGTEEDLIERLNADDSDANNHAPPRKRLRDIDNADSEGKRLRPNNEVNLFAKPASIITAGGFMGSGHTAPIRAPSQKQDLPTLEGNLKEWISLRLQETDHNTGVENWNLQKPQTPPVHGTVSVYVYNAKIRSQSYWIQAPLTLPPIPQRTAQQYGTTSELQRARNIQNAGTMQWGRDQEKCKQNGYVYDAKAWFWLRAALLSRQTEAEGKNLTSPITAGTGGGPNEIHRVVTLARKSSLPTNSKKEWAQRQTERLLSMANFYLEKLHRPSHSDCKCNPEVILHTLVNVSSNENIATLPFASAKEFRSLLTVPGRVTLCVSGIDGSFTNLTGLLGLMDQMEQAGTIFTLFVWKSNEEYGEMTSSELKTTFSALSNGQQLDSEVSYFWSQVIRMGINKLAMSTFVTANRKIQPSGRNVLTPDPETKAVNKGLGPQRLPKPSIISDWTPEAKLARRLQAGDHRKVKPVTVTTASNGKLVCPHCEVHMESTSELVKHLVDTVLQARSSCLFCDQIFPFKPRDERQPVHKHILLHVGEEHKCSFAGCKKVFRYEPELKRHVNTVHAATTATESWPCSICNVILSDQKAWNKHQKRHENHDVACNRCNEQVPYAQLAAHKLYQCPEIPDRIAQCPRCGATFPCNSIARHIRKAHTRVEEVMKFANEGVEELSHEYIAYLSALRSTHGP